MDKKIKRPKINYLNLNSKQQEMFNFQIISAILARKGFSTMKLSDDYNGADFLAFDMLDGEIFKVQLKGCFTLAKKYRKKNLFMAFPSEDSWYLYPHDQVMVELAAIHNYQNTESWKAKNQMYTIPKLTKALTDLLFQYKIEI